MARGILSFTVLACAALTARGENRFWTEASSGEPGEIVTVIVYATNDVELRAVGAMVGFATDVFTYLDTDFGTSALRGAAMELGQIDWSALGAVLVRSYIYFVDGGTPLPPASAWEFARLRFRIRSGIAAGTYGAGVVASIPSKPAGSYMETIHSQTLRLAIIPGTVSVLPSTRPTPPDLVACRQDLQNVHLAWRNLIRYDRVTVSRDGTMLATLDGGAEAYIDASPPLGAHVYKVAGATAAEATLPIACAVEVGPPVVEAVTNLSCGIDAAGVTLSWDRPRDFSAIAVVRNGEPVAMLQGNATTYTDDELPPGTVYYEVIGHVNELASPACPCIVNGTHLLRLGSATVAPGSATAEVPLFLSCPLRWAAFSFGIAIDPMYAPRVRLTDATASGTVLEPLWPFYLNAAMREDLPGPPGCTVAVAVFNAEGVTYLPPALETCALRLRFSVDGLAAGSVVPLRFSANIGSPPVEISTVVDEGRGAQSVVPKTIDGEIVVGAPLVPEVKNLKLANAKGDGVLLTWRNAAAYDAIEVERDGAVIRTLAGNEQRATDDSAGTGACWYRVRGTANGSVSPWSMAIHTALPGAAFFKRGDANFDNIVNVADAVMMCDYLFRGRAAGCLDALDANDDGRINVADPVRLLSYLFVRSLAPPTPGPTLRWYDPTPDALDCAAGAP